VAFKPPFLRFSTVVREERCQHICVRHDPEKFRMIAKFHKIIGSRRCGSSKPKWNARAFLNQSRPIVTICRFQDARFIQNDAAKRRKIEMVDLLIISHEHPGPGYIVLCPR